MKTGIACLILAYALSQFFRVFLAMLAPSLANDLGMTPADLALASGIWFITFAAMQVPVGWALDTFGPRRVSSMLLAIGGAGGALVFGLATTPAHVWIAMGLIGVGCSPVLMASYYIFAKVYPAPIFATLAGATIGIGSFGNLAASVPMAVVVQLLEWRPSMFALAFVTGLVAVFLAIFVRDPARAPHGAKGSVIDLLRLPAIWFIIPIMFVAYAPSVGLRGLWIEPYFNEIYAVDLSVIANASLIMGVAMILGSFAYGPLDWIFGTRKWVAFGGNLLGACALFILFLQPVSTVAQSTILFAVVGFFGASFAVIIAHARSFFPDHLMGRGVTLLNLFGIGGAGLLQYGSGQVYQGAVSSGLPLEMAYTRLFLFFGVLMVLGLLVYAFSEDRVT